MLVIQQNCGKGYECTISALEAGLGLDAAVSENATQCPEIILEKQEWLIFMIIRLATDVYGKGPALQYDEPFKIFPGDL